MQPSTISKRPAVAAGRGVAVLILIASLAGTLPAEDAPAWTSWGGPQGDFVAPSKGLAAVWPPEGPKRLWTRELGDGYSAVLYERGRLYTMYRANDDEAVVCLDATSGETLWERRYAATPAEGHVSQFGEGPRATPLIHGTRLYAIGVSGVMHALDKKTGKVLWAHDLWQDFGGNVLDHGYASSPVAYKNTIIALVGGEGQSLVAFDAKSGKVVWKAHSFKNSYATPRLFDVDGEQQLVTFMAHELIGVDPASGALKWRYAHENQWQQNIATPQMADANHLLLSSPQAGARGLALKANGDTTDVEEIWSTRKIQFYHVSTVREGDWVYGSTGTMAPAFMAAINIRTGEIGWRERGFAKANVVAADGRLLILDEDGQLTLARATPQGLEVLSQATILDKVAWTVPTVVGTTLFVRDKKTLVALDLG